MPRVKKLKDFNINENQIKQDPVELYEKLSSEKKNPKNNRELTVEESKQLAKIESSSEKIRYLDKQRFTRTRIAELLGKRYQHVKNVLDVPLKRPSK